MLKRTIVLFSLFVLFGWFGVALAQAPRVVPLYFFRGEGCPHCAAEEKFLVGLKTRHPGLEVRDYEIWQHPENQKLLEDVGRQFQLDVSQIPLTFVGQRIIVGYATDEISGQQIETGVLACEQAGCPDVLGDYLRNRQTESSNVSENPAASSAPAPDRNPLPEKIKLPLFGEIQVKNVSLPFLTLAIGLLDGFNPCAMWSLVFLITLLLGMKDKKKMWILGGVFILVSGLVYFLFMAAWLNFLLLIGFIVWVRWLIGAAALGFGFYNLREFWVNKEAACPVAKDEKKKMVFEKLKKIVQQKKFWLALAGIVVLAFAVNLVELLCSAGFPAIYTQVLTLNHLPSWQYYLYLLGYIFFYMLDDMLVFAAAMITLRLTGLTNRYTRFSYLVGGLLMLLIGLLLLFKPGWLMFG